jgi:hypothetical protein
MNDVLKFTAECQDFNKRLAAMEFELAAMVREREILLDQARGCGVMVSAARSMLGKLSFNIVMPEGYQPPAQAGEQPADQAIIRHPDKAAE